MTITPRKAGALALLVLLATPAQSLQAESLWKRLMAGVTLAAVWCGSSAQPAQPAALPVPARPHPGLPLRPAGPDFLASHYPPCFPHMVLTELPTLHEALDAARVHYPPELCPVPVPEHLPHERDEPGPEEPREELMATLATQADCEAYEAEVEAGIRLLEREAACALERARTSRRRDRGELLAEQVEDVARLYDNLLQLRRRTARVVSFLEDEAWRARYQRASGTGAPVEELPPADRLACATGCLQDLDLALKRCVREVFPVGMALLPADHPLRKKLKYDYCHKTDADWFAATKHRAPRTSDDPYPQLWILDSPVLD